MANSRDFTGKNRKFTGTKGIVTPKGTTGQRVGSESGELRFNTTTELMEYYDGNQWKPIDAPPTISSISTSDAQGTNNILNADGSTLHTITITGGNFSIGCTAKFIGNTGTEYAAGNVTRVSNSSITCNTTASMGTSDDPYDILITNTSGLAATLEDAFTFNAPPVFATASGQLGTVYNTQVISGTTLNAGATDAEGNTITFTIISGSLPGSGLTISSSTGAITGTLSGTPSLGNYPFVVRASTTEGVVERQFSIQVIANPYISASGGTETNISGYKVHSFTSGTTNFVVSYAGASPYNTIEYLILAGGGSGGGAGGGGAGGLLIGSLTATVNTFSLVVGGGAAQVNGSLRGNDGTASTGFGLTAVGGGGGGNYNPGATPDSFGKPGGSGGGGGYSTGASNPGGAGTAGQGNPGGTGNDTTASPYAGAGGGGAGAPGSNAPDNSPGPGGVGLTSSINGTSYFWAGGGGGGSQTGLTGGAGGSGGGGGGAIWSGGTNGTGGTGGLNNGSPGGPGEGIGGAGGTNTGGGGGGMGISVNIGGAGGSGIIIVRYPRP